jgi:glycerol-3-phosphate acyltransferase PlsY
MGIVSGAAAAYLVGCVPAARFASRLAAGRRWASWAGIAADAAKGFIACAMFPRVGTLGQALLITAIVAGDQWPIVGAERGRLGLAAGIGALTALTPVAPFVWGVLWAAGFTASGYFPVASAVATALLPLALGPVSGWPIGLIALPGCLMVLERLRERLRAVQSGEAVKHHWRIGG